MKILFLITEDRGLDVFNYSEVIRKSGCSWRKFLIFQMHLIIPRHPSPTNFAPPSWFSERGASWRRTGDEANNKNW
jgi:hypothetical protein